MSLETILLVATPLAGLVIGLLVLTMSKRLYPNQRVPDAIAQSKFTTSGSPGAERPDIYAANYTSSVEVRAAEGFDLDMGKEPAMTRR